MGRSLRWRSSSNPSRDGTVKRRIIVDLRRSGANSKSVCPERIILPRISDAIQDLRQLAEDEPQAWQQAAEVEDDLDTWGCEAVSADFSDAYMHWRVDLRERQHCYTVHFEERLADPVAVPLLRLEGGAAALGAGFQRRARGCCRVLFRHCSFDLRYIWMTRFGSWWASGLAVADGVCPWIESGVAQR